ncbi:hypothetical protein UFOVP724_20 [uncultured Caudovirales phage]|uniref:Uncharacterized protein n=1 Tax=uncultured Caudovirales phage TaxID=2100421 RepID=A0A6J5NJB9_9CAUD|nr:hypothetical protein UFOVP724_20 [uncultured Caudovirales phage]
MDLLKQGLDVGTGGEALTYAAGAGSLALAAQYSGAGSARNMLMTSALAFANADPYMFRNGNTNLNFFHAGTAGLTNYDPRTQFNMMKQNVNVAAPPASMFTEADDLLKTNRYYNLEKGSPFMGALAVGLALYFGYDTYANSESDNALRDLVLTEVAANYHGFMHATNRVGDFYVKNSLFGYSGNIDLRNQASGINPRMPGGMALGRLAPILGGYTGAGIGLSVGSSVGKVVGNRLLGLEEDNAVAGMVGAVIGSQVGAKIGALGFSSATLGAGLYLGYTGVQQTVSHEMSILKSGFQERKKMRGLDFANNSQTFFTQTASTMRQRAFDAMSRSQMNARSALGNEAKLMHIEKDAFSTHRRF